MSPSSHSLSGTYMTTLFVTKCRYLLCKSFSFSLQEHAGAIESWEDKVSHYLHQSFGLLPKFCILGSGSFQNLKSTNNNFKKLINSLNLRNKLQKLCLLYNPSGLCNIMGDFLSYRIMCSC